MSEKSGQQRSGPMRPEADLLFCCARVHMTPEMTERIRAAVGKDVDWIQLTRLAMRHGTMPLLYWNLERLCPDGVPKGILNSLRVRFEAEARESQHRALELVRVLGLLDANGIPAVPFKGPSLAQRLYGDLSLRTSNDLDVVVAARHVERAQRIICDLGYNFVWKLHESALEDYVQDNHELQFFRDDIRLDLHWRFTGRSTHVKEDPDRFLRRVEMISLAGQRVPCLSLETNLLVLSLHAAKHKWLQLKLIADIAAILDHDEVDWEYVLGEASDLGLKRVLAVSVSLAQDPLGAAVPETLRRGLKIDRATKILVDQARQSFLEEPDENWAIEADYSFLSQVRERLQDKTRLYLNERLLPRLTPDERDRTFMPMPKQLSAMSYIVRPVRMAWEKIAEWS